MQRILLTLLALSLYAPAVADAKPKLARLHATKVKRAYRRAWDGSYAAWPKDSVAASRVKIAGHKVLLFDVDGNGSFGDFGVDAWTLKDKHIGYVVPLESDLALGARRVTIKFSEDGKALTYVVHGKARKTPEAKAVVYLSRLRMQNGLPPVWMDDGMSAMCKLHCKYMELNGLGHYEVPGKPGFTEEGKLAGLRSGVATDGPVNSVDRFWRAVFHRTGPCNPESRRVGIASAGRFSALWAERARRKWTYPVLIPAPGATEVQTTFDPLENPRPSPQVEAPGMPVQALWRLGSRPPTPASGELRLKDGAGRKIRADFTSPEKPAHAAHPKNRFSLCLLPSAPLEDGRTYWVQMRWEIKGKPIERAWTFTCR